MLNSIELILSEILACISKIGLMDFYISMFVFFGGVFFTFYLLLMNINWQNINVLKAIKKESKEIGIYKAIANEPKKIITRNMQIIKNTYIHIGLCVVFSILCFVAKNLFSGFLLLGFTVLATAYLVYVLVKIFNILFFFRKEQNQILPKIKQMEE